MCDPGSVPSSRHPCSLVSSHASLGYATPPTHTHTHSISSDAPRERDALDLQVVLQVLLDALQRLVCLAERLEQPGLRGCWQRGRTVARAPHHRL
eukprot:310523-Chlamydomonas_euryale.AAC.2